MAEGIITGTQNAYAIATVVAARSLPALKANTVAYQASDPSYKSEVARFGDTINVPIPIDFSTNLMADGGTVTRQNPTLGNAQLVLNRHREITWEHTDVNKAFATPDLQGCSLLQAIANFAEDVDEDLLSVYTLFGTTDVGSYNTALTEAIIDAAETTLFGERVPAGVRKTLVLTGTGYSNLRLIPRFTEADKRGRADAASATLMGRIKDFDVHRAQKCNVTSSTNRHGLAFTPTALLTAVRPLGRQARDGTVQVELNEDGIAIRLTMSYHHEALGEMSTLDTLYGFTTGRDMHGVEVAH